MNERELERLDESTMDLLNAHMSHARNLSTEQDIANQLRTLLARN